MTRRPASRRPPRLDDGPRPVHRPAPPARPVTVRQRLLRGHVAGRHVRFGASEVVWTARRVAAGDDRALLGLPPFPGLGLDEALAAVRDVWDVGVEAPVPSIDPDRTLAGARAAAARVADVAGRGGRIALATGRPASLLPLLQCVAAHAGAAGGDLLRAASPATSPGAGRRGSRQIWWIGAVAVVTDGTALLPDDGVDAGRVLLFDLPRPDLVVADLGFAGHALAEGVETVAPADLDAVALAVAAHRGLPVTLVPMDTGRPAPAYEPLEELLADAMGPVPGSEEGR